MSEPFIILHSGEDRDGWLEARRPVVTATDVARLARGGAGVWAAIRAEKAGRGRDFRNAAMQHGNEREPFIAAYAQSAFGIRPSKALVAASDRPEFAATPDGIGPDEVGEYKTTVHDWAVLSDAPGRYIDQALWQMRVTGRRRARLVFEPHDNGIPLYPFPKDFLIEWDAKRVAELEEVADEFFTLAVAADEDAAELDALLTEYATLAEIADAAKARADAAKARIEDHLDGKPRRFEGSLANLTRSKDGFSKRFDQTALKEADPDTFEKYLRSTPTKGRLTITLRGAA
ncbi:YqaJ viral recombinase family protein [Agromyces sp. G08B096]|uniref:YqaJ viral recombinase family protein n=1 Tax=Agromyces sp. G08B096 TaxID=3156399 RepID=A0AAU7W648_9MICO